MNEKMSLFSGSIDVDVGVGVGVGVVQMFAREFSGPDYSPMKGIWQRASAPLHALLQLLLLLLLKAKLSLVL